MKTFEMILDDIYARANDIQIAEKRRNRKIMKIATSCASICIVFVVAALLIINPFDKPMKDDRVVLEGKNGDKKWITDIPGAVYLENQEFHVDSPMIDILPMNKYDHVEYLRSKPLLVVGEVENIRSFFIDYHRFENGYYSYYITTFDIKVTEDVKGKFETSMLKCVSYVDCSRTDDNPNYAHPRVICGIPNIGRQIIDNPSGLFVLKSTGNDKWGVHGNKYNVSDFADYYVTDRYDCNSEGIELILDTVAFDEIRYTPDFYYTSTKEGTSTDLWKLEDGFELLEERKLFGRSHKWEDKEKANKIKTIEGLGTFTYKESEKVWGTSASRTVEWIYDTFVSEDGSKSVTCLEGMDVMTYYCDNSAVQAGEKIDRLKAKKIADDFIEKYIRYIREDSIIHGHTHEYSFAGEDNSTPGTFTINYVKHIEGVPTDAILTICVNEYGQICSYEGRNIRKYSQLDLIISKEKINDAQERLENALNKMNLDYSIGENRYLATDSNDKVYLSVTVEVKDGNDVISQQMYVPVFYIPQ